MTTADRTSMTDGSYEELRAEAASVNDRLSRNMEGICSVIDSVHSINEIKGDLEHLRYEKQCDVKRTVEKRLDGMENRLRILKESFHHLEQLYRHYDVDHGRMMNELCVIRQMVYAMYLMTTQPNAATASPNPPSHQLPPWQGQPGKFVTNPANFTTVTQTTDKTATWQHKETLPGNNPTQDFMPSGNSLPVPPPPWGQGNAPLIPSAPSPMEDQHTRHMHSTHPNMQHPFPMHDTSTWNNQQPADWSQGPWQQSPHPPIGQSPRATFV